MRPAERAARDHRRSAARQTQVQQMTEPAGQTLQGHAPQPLSATVTLQLPAASIWQELFPPTQQD